ncbi:MAG TPA: two-component regulator propeller domain-containing protein [Bacteroidales bacterium]|nr:two-component regulator propeller domain-containing protein [Bacteroidales bacterium]
MIKKLLYFSFAVFFTACSDDDPEKTKVVLSNLDNKEITSIVLDNFNKLWVGTDSGLYCQVEAGYELQDVVAATKILSLGYEKASNTLWVGTSNGLTKCTITDGVLSGTGIDAAKLSSNKVYASHIDAKSIRWFGTASGPTMNKDDKWKKENLLVNALDEYINLEFAKSQVNAIASWDGDVYFATSGKIIYRAYGYNESLDAFTGASQLSSPYNGPCLSDTMNAVFVDSQNRIWMGGNSGLQFIVGHETKSPDIFGFTENDLPSARIHAIAEGKDGRLWVGTEKGLAILENQTWTAKTSGLPNLYVTAIAFDKDGKAWVGTKKGLVKL